MMLEDDGEKPLALVRLLKGRPRARAIVFVATKRGCHDLERSVRGRISGRCAAIHGDKSQAEREAALQAFKNGDCRVLFATDVAGRGLDVPGVMLVVNFDPPWSAEDYVHRIGRTGRAGNTGLAISLLTFRNSEAMGYIADVMRRTGLRLPPALDRALGRNPELAGGSAKKPPAFEPRACWRDPWEKVGGTRYSGTDLASAVANLWPEEGATAAVEP